MNFTNLLFAFVFLLVTSSAFASAPSCTLQPLRAMDIEYIVPEPSGISFCNSTGTLFAISDDDHAIFELNLEGQIIRTIFLDKNVKNIEAVTCDNVNQLLIITEEKKAKVTSYKLNNYNLIGGKMEAIYVDSFTLNLPEHLKSDSGFEGITIDTTTGHFLIANEKEPRVIMEVTRKGVIVDYYLPEYCEDLSDLEYEASSDILWVTSDMSKTVLATNRTTGEVIDSWNIPVRNSEGIAVTNDKIYVLTDPSSKKSAQYVGGLLIFAKPVIGTGLQGGVCSGDEFSSEECIGCDLFFARAKDNKKAFEKEEHKAVVHHREVVGAKLIALAVIGCVATIAVVLLFAVALRVRRNFLVRRSALSSAADDEESFDAGTVALSHSLPSTSLEIVV